MNDQAFLNTPGELLTAARRKSGIGMADLSERTKIPVIMLEAVERDEYHRISDPLYVKSFLRAFAAEVGVDPDEILEIYGRMTGSARSATATEEVWEEQKVTIRRVGLPWGRILVWTGLVVVILVVAVFLVRTLGGGDDEAPVAVPATPGEPTVQTVAQDTAAPPEIRAEEAATAVEVATIDRDSLARGWLAEAPRQDPPPVSRDEPVVDEPAEKIAEDTREESRPAVPAQVVAEPQAPVRESEPEPAPVTTPAAATGFEALPPAAVGGAGLSLAAGQPRSQVLRIRTTVPVTASVRRDGERSYTRYHLPGNGRDLSPLPATDIAVGTAYAVQGGVVAYWGARDHFDLVLDRVDGVEISLNGAVRDLSGVRPGDELVLDAFRPPSGR